MLYAFMETKEVMKVNGYEIAYSIFSVPKSPNTGFISCFLVSLCPGGYSIYPCVGRCGPARHTLTLCKTKIADFPTLFKTEFRFLIACVRHLTRNHARCKTMINKNFAVVQFVEHTRRLFIVQEKIPCLRQKLIKSIPCLRQKNPEKHTLAGRTSPLSPQKGLPPTPPPLGRL